MKHFGAGPLPIQAVAVCGMRRQRVGSSGWESQNALHSRRPPRTQKRGRPQTARVFDDLSNRYF